jgi:3-dehydroquinate synthase
MTSRVTVATAAPYDVVIGHGLLSELPSLLTGATRAAIIHPAALRASAEAMRLFLTDEGLEAIILETPDAEEAKTAEVAAFCWSVLGQAGFTRSDVIIGHGGGATTDLSGFIAATWLRGVRHVAVPTTLLGMVDAAVGGKTGINTAEGKNLVGSFHEPVGVLCDLTALATLPRNDLLAGMAEVVKCGFIRDVQILEMLEADPDGCTQPDDERLAELIRRSVQVKADVVAADLRETAGAGGREILNYGHTLGHAIEKAERYRWRHGAAISVGMVFAAELGRLAGRLSPSDVQRHRDVLTRLGLPTTYRGDRWEALLDAMRVDKKARGHQLRFVVLDAIGRPTSLDGPDPSLLVAAFQEIAEETR